MTNAPATTATEGVTYRYTLTASDPDGNPVTITAPTHPEVAALRGPGHHYRYADADATAAITTS